jgi:predicted amidohydrolase YtcJ
VRLADQELLSKGITSIQDASISNNPQRWADVVYLKKSSILGPRVNFMLGVSAFERVGLGAFTPFADERQLRLNSVKIIVDETTGSLCPTQAELDRMVFEIHQSGLQAAIHAIEEKAIKAAAASIHSAQARLLREDPHHRPRHRIEHCSVCPPELAREIARLGVMVVTQPSFIYHNGDRYLETVEKQQLNHLYPIRTLFQSGVRVAGSSDCPVVPPDPLLGVHGAMTRMSETGREVLAQEAVSLEQAIALYTVCGAEATREEHIKGTIAPGKLADLVVLNADPFELPPHELKSLAVEMTILNGEVVWVRK